METDKPSVELTEFWDPTPPTAWAHSRLFCLEPMGLGTPSVESMTSYVVRLAMTHHVQVSRLVVNEMIPLWGPNLLSRHQSMSPFWLHSASLNGVSAQAARWAEVMEELTQRGNLSALTMLPWAAVVAPGLLLRSTRAWCPRCYDAWRLAKQPVYDPLLWALQVVTLCPTHQEPLRTSCPYPDCGRTMHFLSPMARPGHCAHCGRWLGASQPEPGGGTPCPADELQWQRWVTTVVGELLMSATRLSSFPTEQTLARTLPRYLQGRTDISQWQFEQETCLCVSAFRSPRAVQHAGTLHVLLRACAFLKISLLTLFEAEQFAQHPRFEQVPAACNLPRFNPRTIDWVEIGQKLETALADGTNPPLSMRQIAQAMGHNQSRLIAHFPELCHAISARYVSWRTAKSQARVQRLREEIREAAKQLHAQGIFPGKWQVQDAMDRPLLMRDKTARDVWQEVMTELGLLHSGPPDDTALEA